MGVLKKILERLRWEPTFVSVKSVYAIVYKSIRVLSPLLKGVISSVVSFAFAIVKFCLDVFKRGIPVAYSAFRESLSWLWSVRWFRFLVFALLVVVFVVLAIMTVF